MDKLVSVSTIHRYSDLVVKVAKREIDLFFTNKAKRLAFAQEMIKKPDEYYRRILWSDETKVQGWPNSEKVLYRAPAGSHKTTPMKQNGGGGVMFWGCMSYYAWGPLVVCEGTINGDKYLELLKDVVIPEIEASEHDLIFEHLPTKSVKLSTSWHCSASKL